MKNNIKCLKIFFILTLLSIVKAELSDKSQDTPVYFVGGEFLYNIRIGSYLFESIEKRMDTARTNLLLVGVGIGKRYYIVPWLRLQMEGMFHIGITIEDTLYDFYMDESYCPKYSFKHGCFNIGMQIIRPREKISPLVHLGGGINLLSLEESVVLQDDHKKEVNYYTGINLRQWSLSLNFGAGFDISLKRNLGLSLIYSYRLWQPVRYKDSRDMPLEAVDYKETFYTHIFQILLLFNLLKD